MGIGADHGLWEHLDAVHHGHGVVFEVRPPRGQGPDLNIEQGVRRLDDHVPHVDGPGLGQVALEVDHQRGKACNADVAGVAQGAVGLFANELGPLPQRVWDPLGVGHRRHQQVPLSGGIPQLDRPVVGQLVGGLHEHVGGELAVAEVGPHRRARGHGTRQGQGDDPSAHPRPHAPLGRPPMSLHEPSMDQRRIYSGSRYGSRPRVSSCARRFHDVGLRVRSVLGRSAAECQG